MDLEIALESCQITNTCLLEYSEAQYKRLLRKIDYYLIPMMFFCYGIQQTDKTSISIQALFGMSDDLGLHGQQYQWLTTIFYITYLVGEFPSTWLLQKYHLGRTLTLYMVGWSICLLCISACNNWSQLMALRALQGFFECNITPGFMLITGAWYRTEEHANRSLFWQSSQGFFSIICNLILYGIARHVTKVGGIDPWRCISLFLGGLTLLGAVFSWFILGSPHEVKWLSEEERRIATARVIENQISEDTVGKKWSWAQFRECFRDPQVYFGFFNTLLACIPNGPYLRLTEIHSGITAFSSLMYQTFGFDEWGSMLYGLPRNGMYVVVFILVALYLRKFQNHRMWIMIVSCILPFVGMLVMSLLPNTPKHKWVKWGMYDMTVVFSLALFLGWSLVTSNVAGRTKRTVVSSLTLIAYCVGNMIGAQVFQTKDAPRYMAGTITCCACFGAEVVIIVVWRLWYMYENRRRDRVAEQEGLGKEEIKRLGQRLGAADKTDFENLYFRYSM
ncbi:major facilitator superfamily domain-containing protein [Aspergillus cavernicola]|uniref:Major facilitator superfamily domain-containing protein n=1 Tax=Aspergillus cavernicola TaxID=176166 RepID=A0ABR4J0I3_9EURO